MTLSEKLLKAREKLHYSQQKMGELVGREKCTISKYEKGMMRPSPNVAAKYIELCPDVLSSDDFIFCE